MRRAVVGGGIVALLMALVQAPIAARAADEPLVDQVRRSIERGVKYLRDKQNAEGNWEEIDTESHAFPGGWTSLALLAMLQSGVPADDPAVKKGLAWLRTVSSEDNKTYAVSLQTMVLAVAKQDQDRERIKSNVDWLLANIRRSPAKSFLGWTYSPRSNLEPDNSNTQYALLALYEAHLARTPIPDAIWKEIRDFYLQTQTPEGDWLYQPRQKDHRLTMATAGLCGLIISGAEAGRGFEKPLGNGAWENCGRNEENRAITKALDLIAHQFPGPTTLNERLANLYYCLYGIERTGRLTGQRFFGDHDWYRAGCKFLVPQQTPEGFWKGRSLSERSEVIATSFALLFLSKGRTPVLISKLPHGTVAARAEQPDWNNDRNDARHLVEFASQELFKGQPLAWQIFNADQVEVPNTDDLVAELLQSPIVYFNGHRAPEFTGREKEMLKKYVDNGGFILAEACCGSPEFDKGFRELMQQVFEGDVLRPLPDDHPIWTASGKFLVRPGRLKLYGIDIGCKTVVIYSPQDLSCLWETNKYQQDEEGRRAFQLGANIIAYATGMEPPKPRLHQVKMVREEAAGKRMTRGYLKAAQLRHDGDWRPAPRALPNLMRELRDQAGLDVVIGERNPDGNILAKQIRVTDPDLPDYKFLYMHGRKTFAFDPKDLEGLRFNLENNGILFADACCGCRQFDQAFRKFAADLLPNHKLEVIPLSDDLYSKELNGTAITKVRRRRLGPDGRKPEPMYRTEDPFLEGIKVNGRWAVIYSKYDIGCALENRSSINCLGHDRASAVQLASAAVLYYLRP